MFTHIVVGTNDPAASAAFYDATFAALGIAGNRAGDASYYGSYETGFLSVNRPRDGQPATFANGGTIGLAAASQSEVDAWHAAGLANGGSDEGAPGRRDMGENKLYGAYLRDPVGNKLAAFTTNVED
ncbi:VOC family protein [Aurantiacibacter poecillastricola]|uniref:VOC family protein n=1 Tax=Aurantiacibacter poecillastricola TaxID=3064385 RepID=UPI00273D9653|nr:VOC family protein [Aurantiacibacter sp. 219JJ12-13]MDP5260151.1 VOC family protein [Aurantiacibacter sp. 219JJ12-13]